MRKKINNAKMLIASSSNKIIFNKWSDVNNIIHTYETEKSNFIDVNTISWSRNGTWIVYVTDDGTTELISVKNSLKLLYTISDIDGQSCAAFANNTNRFLAIGCKRGRVLLYDLKNNCERTNFQHAKSTIYKISYITSDTHLIVGCENGELMLFNNKIPSLMSTYRLHNFKKITNFRCHPYESNLVTVSCNNGIVATWNIQTNKTIDTFHLHDMNVIDAVFIPTRTDTITSIGLDKKICIYNTNCNECVINVPIDAIPNSMDVSPSGDGLIIGTCDGSLLSYDMRNMKEPLQNYQLHQRPVKQVLFQKDNYYNISVNNDDISTTDIEENNYNSHESSELSGNLFNLSTVPAKFETSNSKSDSAIAKNRKETISYKQGSITEGVRKLLSHKPNLLGPSNYTYNNINEMSITTDKITCDDLRRIDAELIENKIKTAIGNKIETLKNDLIYETQDLRSYINMRFLDFHMFLVKEFLQIECQFNTMKELMSGNQNLSEQYLVQENLKLKLENHQLREKLRNFEK